MPALRITQHAIDRYIERVDQGASRSEARLVIGRIASLGRVRTLPRHWMRDTVRAAPGVQFIYYAGEAGICLVVHERAIVTVLTRGLCRQTRRANRLQLVPPVAGGRRASASERARWRWDGNTDEEAA